MNIQKLLKIQGIELVEGSILQDRTVQEFYTCDLLSWAMGHIRGDHTLLLTVLSSMNVVGVASLLDLPAIMFCEGAVPKEEVIHRANQEKISLFTSTESSAQTLKRLFEYETKL